MRLYYLFVVWLWTGTARSWASVMRGLTDKKDETGWGRKKMKRINRITNPPLITSFDLLWIQSKSSCSNSWLIQWLEDGRSKIFEFMGSRVMLLTRCLCVLPSFWLVSVNINLSSCAQRRKSNMVHKIVWFQGKLKLVLLFYLLIRLFSKASG